MIPYAIETMGYYRYYRIYSFLSSTLARFQTFPQITRGSTSKMAGSGLPQWQFSIIFLDIYSSHQIFLVLYLVITQTDSRCHAKTCRSSKIQMPCCASST
jgi:hypothetical protein